MKRASVVGLGAALSLLCISFDLQAQSRSGNLVSGGILGNGLGCDRVDLPAGDSRQVRQLDSIIRDCAARIMACDAQFPTEAPLCTATYGAQRGRAYLLLAMARAAGGPPDRGLIMAAIADLDGAVAVSPRIALTAIYLHYRAAAHAFAEKWPEAARDLDQAEAYFQQSGNPQQIDEFREAIRPLRRVIDDVGYKPAPPEPVAAPRPTEPIVAPRPMDRTQTFFCPASIDQAMTLITVDTARRSISVGSSALDSRLPCSYTVTDGITDLIWQGTMPGSDIPLCAALFDDAPLRQSVAIEGDMVTVALESPAGSKGFRFNMRTGVFEAPDLRPIACRVGEPPILPIPRDVTPIAPRRR